MPNRDGEHLTTGQQHTSDRLDQAVDDVKNSVKDIGDTQELIRSLATSVPDLADSMREIAVAYRESTASQVEQNEEARRQNLILARTARRNGLYIGIACLLVLIVGLGVFRINQVVGSVRDAQHSNRETLALITQATSAQTQKNQAQVLEQAIACLENHGDINAAKQRGAPSIPLLKGCPPDPNQ